MSGQLRSIARGSWLLAATLLTVGAVLVVVGGGAVDARSLALRVLGSCLTIASLLALPRREPEKAPELPRTSSRWSASELRLLVLVIAAGALVRIVVAVQEPVHYDEAFTLLVFGQVPAGEILTSYFVPNNHILHSLLVKVCTDLFGTSALALRLPALIAGIALMPATAALATRLVSRQAALLATAVVAGAPALVSYSANARSYSLVALSFVVMLLALWSIVGHAAPRRRDVFTLTAASTVCLLATPSAAIAVTGAWLWGAWLVVHRRRITPRLIASAAMSVVAVGVVVIGIYWPIRNEAGFDYDQLKDPTTLSSIVGDLDDSWFAGWSPLAFTVMLALGAYALWFAREVEARAALVSLFAALLLAVVVITVALGRIPPAERTYLYLLPVVSVAASAGAVGLLRRVFGDRPRAAEWGVAVLALLVFVPVGVAGISPAAWGSDPRPLADAEQAARTLARLTASGEVPPQTPLLTVFRVQPSWNYAVMRSGLTTPTATDLSPDAQVPAPAVVAVPITEPMTLEGALHDAGLQSGYTVTRTIELKQSRLVVLRLDR